MNAEFKQRWLTALRSGKYQQTVGNLRTGNNFCCLGVACDLIDPTLWPRSDYEYVSGYIYEFDGENSVLPLDIAELIGMESGTPTSTAGMIPELQDRFAVVTCHAQR